MAPLPPARPGRRPLSRGPARPGRLAGKGGAGTQPAARPHSACRGPSRDRGASSEDRRGARPHAQPAEGGGRRKARQGDSGSGSHGLADPDPPTPPARLETPPGLGPLVELLRVLLKERCEEYQVAQRLVASAEDLEAIAADDAAPVRALSGWRRAIFGEDALALKHGRLALTAAGNRIRLVTLPAPPSC